MKKMKDSGVEWIGEIPEGWQITKIGNLYDIVLGKMLSSKPVNDTDTLENYICATNIKWQGVNTDTKKQMWFSEEEKEMYLLRDGDVLVMEGGMAGTSCIYKREMEPCYMQNSALRCRSKLFGDNRFIYYWMHAVYNTGYIDSICNKATIQHYTKDKISHTPMTVMPLKEQTRLVDYLDTKCSKIDAIISRQEEIIIKLKEYKSAIITETVTRGLNLDIEMKDSGIEWIEKYPTHWNEYRIANLYDQTSESGIEELPILTVSINSGISDRELTDDEKDRVFVRSEDRTKYKRVRPGDLAYNMMRAWQGAFGAVRVDGMVSPAYVTCRPKPGVQIDSRYIEYLFRTPIAIEEMHRYSHGIADFRLRLYWPEFKNIRLCLPPIEEQMEIADYIDEKTAKIEATIKKREETIAKLQEYKKSLIYEVVTGKREVL